MDRRNGIEKNEKWNKRRTMKKDEHVLITIWEERVCVAVQFDEDGA